MASAMVLKVSRNTNPDGSALAKYAGTISAPDDRSVSAIPSITFPFQAVTS